MDSTAAANDKSRHSRQAENSAVEPELLRSFALSKTPMEFCQSWLSLQCIILNDVRCGLVLLGPQDRGPFTPAAIWPNLNTDVNHLVQSAERALKERRGFVARSAHNYFVAYPIEVDGKLHGAVVLEAAGESSEAVQHLMRMLHWGAAWLEVLIRRQASARAGQSEERLKSVLESIAVSIEHEGSQASAMAFVTKLAATLDCRRVSLGLVKGRQVKVYAISHSAGFADKMNLVRAIGSAMDEAVDQQTNIVHPLPENVPPIAAIAHNELAAQHGSGAICTVPIMRGTTPIGALTCERPAENPFDDQSIELIKTLATLVGPVLILKKREERSIWIKNWEACVSSVMKFVGPDRPGLKLAAGAAFVLIVFFIFAKGDHRVRATTVLEGVVQRAITAPFNGYVAESVARPGDVVQQGSMLCRLDERDLTLERLKWLTQREQVLRQFSEAMAKHERAQIMIAQAKADQADAQISLLDEQISRARIVAPFDGVVTSGDLSQSLGSPVERGQVLYEIAPLQGYRVIVQVDETDISYVAAGQKGELALPSIPGTVLPFAVSKVTPVSTAKEGRNYFRVEAQLDKTAPQLRPGMEGVGKITVERRRLIWIWTHDALEWLRLKTWTWLP